ncbi:MAG: TPM domain-containing protein [Pseudomonadota bacterium]
MSLSVQAQKLPEYRSVFVNDFANILSPVTEADLARMLQEARDVRALEMTVVTISRHSDYGTFRDLADFSTKLFNAWGIGSAARNDGVLLVVSSRDREVRIALGDGYPARWDGVATRIIQRDMLPELGDLNYDAAVLNGVRASLEAFDLTDPQAAPSVNDRVSYWVENNIIVILVVSLFGFFTIPIWTKRIAPIGRAIDRVWPRKCPECGRRLIRLGEVQEDQYLSDAQRLEEHLNTKDHVVWFCPHDEHLLIKGYPKTGGRFAACPECGYHTCHVHKRVLTPATTSTFGEMELSYQCENCAYRNVSLSIIPRLLGNDGSNRSSSGRGFRAGSGGSGGFGGGSSSGGGGSGRF